MESGDLRELYRSESRDLLERLGRSVLAVERGEGRDAVDEAFRAAHTLKGMAASMGHHQVVALAHGMEHLLEKLRSGAIVADPQVVDLLVSALRELERVVEVVLGAAEAGSAAPAAGPMRAASRGAAGSAEPRYVRVEQGRIDTMMDRASEIVVARERLLRLARQSGDREIERVANGFARALGELRDDAIRLRLAPVGELADRLQLIAREAARAVKKEVAIEVVGGEVEIDRALLTDLSELLTHLLRNAIDHGIESLEERVARGKSASGTVRIVATQSRDSVMVRVQDDGRGVDRERIVAQAIASGVRRPEAISRKSEAEILDLLVMPGFSTATKVTQISGRGVGLDQVASRLRELGGELRLESRPGLGASFTVVLPRTLSLTRVLMMECGDEVLAIPSAAVERVEDAWAGGTPAATEPEHGEEPEVVVADLARLCGLAGTGQDGDPGYAVVLGRQDRRVKLRVNSVAGFQDVVIKRFAVPRGTRDLFSGAAILADGRPRLIVDPARVVARARWRAASASRTHP